jgi:hypothetical protein
MVVVEGNYSDNTEGVVRFSMVIRGPGERLTRRTANALQSKLVNNTTAHPGRLSKNLNRVFGGGVRMFTGTIEHGKLVQFRQIEPGRK